MNALIKQLQIPFLIILLAIGTLYIFTALFGPIPFSVKSTVTTNSDLFSVTGTGEEKAVPDTAQFTVGVTKTAATVEEAKDEVNKLTSAITDELKQLGIEEKNIKTQNFNSYPNSTSVPPAAARPQTMSLQVIGPASPDLGVASYTVSQDLVITAKSIDLANKALDAAVANGANQIAGVSFTVNDEDRKALQAKARKKAIADAKSKATEIANDAGLKLGKVVNIYVADQGQPIMFDAKMESAARAGTSAPTDLQPGENTVSVTVTLSYETL